MLLVMTTLLYSHVTAQESVKEKSAIDGKYATRQENIRQIGISPLYRLKHSKRETGLQLNQSRILRKIKYISRTTTIGVPRNILAEDTMILVIHASLVVLNLSIRTLYSKKKLRKEVRTIRFGKLKTRR